MTTQLPVGIDELAKQLSARFGITWDPEVMAHEEPHIFKSVPPTDEVHGNAKYK